MSFVCTTGLQAQTVALKSDLLTGVFSSPNLGVEVKLSERFSLEAGVHYNPFPAGGNKRWKHWFVQPELRYWKCQPYGGHFFGAHLIYGVYNMGNIKLPLGLFKGARSARYEGDFMGAGVSYGYHFILSPRDKHRRRISAYGVRTLPVPALRGADGRREPEFHRSHKGGGVAGVCDKVKTPRSPKGEGG